MTRNGKIARLPHNIREQLNRRLRDNVPGTKICEWVNRLPACRKVCAEFARRSGSAKSPVTVNQLSEWRRGGYQDWLREQQALEETRELRKWCAKLGRDGGDITEGVATLLSGQLLKLVVAAPLAFKRPSASVRLQRDRSSGETQLRSAECGVRNGGSCSSVGQERSRPDCSPGCGQECPRSGEMEGTKSEVRLMEALVRCLSGIRRGDQNRVRLAQSEKKLALRSKLAAITVEKYEKEKAKEEELERQKRAAERRRKQSPVSKLDDHGQIDLLRGKLFGPDLVVMERERVLEEREKETKRLRMELEILKAEMPASRRAKGGGRKAEGGGRKAKGGGRRTEGGGRRAEGGAVQSPMSNVTAAPVTAAPSGGEPIRVNTSAYDQSQGKNTDGGGQGAEVSTHPPTQNFGATSGRKDAEAQGKFDVQAMLRETREIDKELAALWAELGLNEEDRRLPTKSGLDSSTSKAEDEKEQDKFDPDEALRELEGIKKEVAALKARQRAELGAGKLKPLIHADER